MTTGADYIRLAATPETRETEEFVRCGDRLEPAGGGVAEKSLTAGEWMLLITAAIV